MWGDIPLLGREAVAAARAVRAIGAGAGRARAERAVACEDTKRIHAAYDKKEKQPPSEQLPADVQPIFSSPARQPQAKSRGL